MKRFVLPLLFISLFLYSCKLSISNNETQKTEGEVTVANKTPEMKTVKIYLSSGSARTALPDIDFSDELFTYNLTVIQNPGEANQKDPVIVFENQAYANLSRGFTLEEGKYKFILDAYHSGVKSMSGEIIFDLSLGGTALDFVMFPVKGSSGKATVKINFPNDGSVAVVKAAVCTDIFTDIDSAENVQDLKINLVSGKRTVTYSTGLLPSNTEQYAHFWFYDKNGALVYSGVESLIIVGGCVSTSELNLTTDDWHTYLSTVQLKKDNIGWKYSNKVITLVDVYNPDCKYELKETTDGKFTASVAEGDYSVFIKEYNAKPDDEYLNNPGTDTEVIFSSVYKNTSVDFYSITFTNVKNCSMIPVSQSVDSAENIEIVQKGATYIYQIKLSDGYEKDNSSFAIKQNGDAIFGPAFDKDIIIRSVTEPMVISVEGINAKTYKITYKDSNGDKIYAYSDEIASNKMDTRAYWITKDSDNQNINYTPVASFTAEDVISLPDFNNVRKNGSFFDAWLYGDQVIKTSEGIYQDIELTASWKGAPTIDADYKIIYANGFNLLITGDTATTNNKTLVYIDYNGDGVFNFDDVQLTYDITENDVTTTCDDFTGFELTAGSEDGDLVVKSDFIFTMTGGIISSIYGLDSKDVKHQNKSTLNISGTAHIGSIAGKVTTTNPDSSQTITATEVKGIMLDTLSDQRVNIVGQMKGYTKDGKYCNYEITCVASYGYEADNEHVVAYIKNSKYATFNYVTCWTESIVDPEAETPQYTYKNCLLTQKNVLQNGANRTIIRIADDGGIAMPAADEVTADGIDPNEFRFNNDVINLNCSVFSIAVENGSFRVNERLTITENRTDTDVEVENTLTYMAQPVVEPASGDPYVTSFEFDTQYVYMQVMSEGNQLTPEMASNFLSQIYFKPDEAEDGATERPKMKVTVNLETVPSSEIAESGVMYFNGSFYKRFKYTSDKSKYSVWPQAYDFAKATEFNGLQGYLMNVTSMVENYYVFNTFKPEDPDKENGLSWIGGSPWKPKATIDNGSGEQVTWYDQKTYPEWGVIDTETGEVITKTNSTTGCIFASANPWVWQSGPEAGVAFYSKAAGNDGAITGVFHRWNNATIFSDLYSKDPDSGKPIIGYNTSTNPTTECKSAEPNGSEIALQLLCGKIVNGTKVYICNGFWNNANWWTNSGPYASSGYIVEYTPYDTIYDCQRPANLSIRRSASY